MLVKPDSAFNNLNAGTSLTAPFMSSAGLVKNAATGALSGGNQASLTADVSGTLPIANGGTNATSFTQGSVLFMGASGFAEDNTNLFWDDSTDTLTIGNAGNTIATFRSAAGGFSAINFYSDDATETAVKVHGLTGQSGALTVWVNDINTELASVSASGAGSFASLSAADLTALQTGVALYAGLGGRLYSVINPSDPDSGFGKFYVWGSGAGNPDWTTTQYPTTLAVGDLLYASATDKVDRLADVATGQVLVSGGVNTAPAWSASPSLTDITAATFTTTGTNSHLKGNANPALFAASAVNTYTTAVIRGAASQSANLTEWQDSGSNVLSSVGPDGRVVLGPTLDAATGNEYGMQINTTVNKATSGTAYGLQINVTDTASPGALYPLEVNSGGSYKLRVDEYGYVYASSFYFNSSAIYFINAQYLSTIGGYLFRYGTNVTSGNCYSFEPTNGTEAMTASSGTQAFVQLAPIYNQSGTAAGTDLLVNRTETAVGSGAQLLMDLQVGSTSKFNVANDGGVFVPAIKSGATQGGAGAAAGELWKTASHATLPDNVVMIGV